ncbi:H/ACA ribonucleoprotein complex non-core subunit NAF1-like [Anneissia japonica]|uniref:H/ACA ribonucleoprotein complex non-core subunit NAF1-like n=1 Tax=Anneissia japonica TaxID=1529436 RepID=UPI0014257103|nr:H/ACA ribonucleoprotein complex non-core subunit NAF1-like [Anneissia japonica]
MDTELNEQCCSHPESKQDLGVKIEAELETTSECCQLVSQKDLHRTCSEIPSNSPLPESVTPQNETTTDHCTQNTHEGNYSILENLKECSNFQQPNSTGSTKMECDNSEENVVTSEVEPKTTSLTGPAIEKNPLPISRAAFDQDDAIHKIDVHMEEKNLISSDISSSSSDETSNESETESSISGYEVHSNNEAGNEVEEKSIQVPHPPATIREIQIEDLPEVQYINMVLDEKVKLSPLGVISSIIGQLVIIKSLADTPALDMETVLFKEDRQALGKVFEVFGPVQNPLYSMRFNSTTDVSNLGIMLQLDVFYAPSALDLTAYVFTSQLLKIKGSDASWKGDEEPPEELLEYSDDEKEKAAKAKKKQNRDPHKRKTPSQKTGQKLTIGEEKKHSTGNGMRRFRQDAAANNKNARNWGDLGRNPHPEQPSQSSARGSWPQHQNYQPHQPHHMSSYQQYSQYRQTSPYHQHPALPINVPPPPYGQIIPPNVPFPPPAAPAPPASFQHCPPTVPPYIDTSKPPPSMWNSQTPYSYSGQPRFGSDTNNHAMDMLSFLMNVPPPPPPT